LYRIYGRIEFIINITGVIMVIKCGFCGNKFSILHQDGDTLIINPHWCDYMQMSYYDKVCTSCDSLIRCRRDGFDCREAVAYPTDPQSAAADILGVY
jgi:hypothetical protein